MLLKTPLLSLSRLLPMASLRVPLLCVVTVLVVAASGGPRPPAPRPGLHDPDARHLPLHGLDQMESAKALSLPPASAQPAPLPPEVSLNGPLAPHEVFGFAPYWTLDASGGFDLRDLSTVGYFGVDVNPDGSLQRSGNGWEGFQSQALADLVSRAHGAQDRVVLTAKTFDAPTLHRLVTDQSASAVLVAQLAEAIRSKAMDGANLDFEGTGGADRSAMAAFVRRVADGLHAEGAHWQVTVDTYASSAGDSSGWFDVRAMEPSVDAFFVMAYDMDESGVASPTAPLTGYSTNDEAAVSSYVAAVPRNKVLLGVPFYGYDWVTGGNAPNQAATGAPTPVSYAQVSAGAHPSQWDDVGKVPWTAYQQDGHWHEVYYDDPTSIALKAQLASSYRILGTGIWALGMDGNSPAMMAALVGGHRPIKPSLAGAG
ncbi:MAG TPA: glycosyl hydrolase family 18 protein, partial [Candidatus Dormibacteraeota bacterium]